MTSKGKKFSVIIPTYNRAKILEKVLLSLNKQDRPFSDFEVIVINDGSHDSSYQGVIENLKRKIKYDFFYFPQEKSGRASVRNVGIKKARGRRLVFIGDDIVVTTNFLREHQRLGKKNVAVLGYTRMPSGMKKNDFMKFLDRSGLQFNYKNVGKSGEVDFWRFYTSNISLERKWFNQIAFDGDFGGYGFEDTELGYRLANKGLKIIFNKKAVAYHFHELDFSDFIRRQKSIGVASFVFARKHPELRSKLIKPYWSVLLAISFLVYKTKIIYYFRRDLYWNLAGVYFKYLYYLKARFKQGQS